MEKMLNTMSHVFGASLPRGKVHRQNDNEVLFKIYKRRRLEMSTESMHATCYSPETKQK